MSKKSNVLWILFILLFFGCKNESTDSRKNEPGINNFTSRYNFKINYSDSLDAPEFLLQLVVKNNNKIGAIIKFPVFKVITLSDGKRLRLEELFDKSDIGKTPSSFNYEDSVLSSSRNPLRASLRRFIIDSLSKSNVKVDDDAITYYVHGVSFIEPSSESIFLLDLTYVLNKIDDRFKIYFYYESTTYDYKANYVPDEFQGYKKIFGDMKFDTFYLESNQIRKTDK